MVKSLNDVKWKEFCLEDIFINYHGKRLIKEKRIEGFMPLLTASELNQGVSDFISNSEMKAYKNFISIDMFGHAFYHNYSAYGDDNIYFFINDNITPKAKLFIVTCINQNSLKYSYGNQFRQDNADKDKILLPVNSKGEPDYEFMEKYIKEREAKLKEQYKNHIKARVAELTKEINPAQKWDDFFISDIFTSIQRGKRLTKVKQTIGKIPYVSSTSLNNGVDNFIGNDTDVRIFQDCLSLANSGSVGSCFYEPFKFVASDHVTHLKNNYSKYTYLFLACLLYRLSEKYNFNREINDDRISREKILLPVTPKGEPDYTYMENYMKYLEQKKLLEYLNYIK